MENMKFYGLLDFYPRKEELKKKYQSLTLKEVYTYKMYVYSLPFEDDKNKDLIWEFLNDWPPALSELAIKYRKRKEQNDRRQKKYEEQMREENEEMHDNVKFI